MRAFAFLFSTSLFCISCISLAYGGEAPESFSIQDVGGEWFRNLFNMGTAGCIIIWLIYDKDKERKHRRDDKADELRRRDKENERWEKMDMALLEMVANTSRVISEIQASNTELRSTVVKLTERIDALGGDIQRLVTLMSTGADYRRRVSDVKQDG